MQDLTLFLSPVTLSYLLTMNIPSPASTASMAIATGVQEATPDTQPPAGARGSRDLWGRIAELHDPQAIWSF